MARTARVRKPQPTLTNKNPQAAADEQPANKDGSPDRQANGRFARGNPGGPGNPHARFSAQMLTIARQTMTPEKMAAVFESIYIRALGGDMTAAKLLMYYTIGKPGDAPHPDHIERDEWDLHRKNAIAPDEMKQALGRLPCSLGNEIVGAALPAMTAARADELAAQLRGEKEKDEGRGMKDEPNGPCRAPSSENAQDQTATAVDPWNIDVVPPLRNGKLNGESATASPATRDQPPTTNPSIHDSRTTIHEARAPIGNGVPDSSAKAKKRRKLVAKQWLQPLARKLTGRKQKGKKLRATPA